MANYTLRKNQDGSVSCTIRVHRGRGADHKQLKPFTKTVRLDGDLTTRQLNRAAASEAALFERECEKGRVALENPKFETYAAYVLAQKLRGGMKPTSALTWERSLKRLNAEIGGMRIQDIQARHLNKLYTRLEQSGNERTGKGLSPQSIHVLHGVFGSVMSTAFREGLIQVNPATRCILPKQEPPKVDALTLDEVEAVLSALESEPAKWRTFFNLAICTGLRRGELAGLCWDSVDTKANTLHITRNLTYTPSGGNVLGSLKTGTKSNRFITVPLTMSQMLEAWHQEQRALFEKIGVQNPLDLCFTTDEGKPINPSNINTWLRTFCKRHGLRVVHCHQFRHTAATLLIGSGLDLASVAQRLGHSKLSTTANIYTHATSDADAKVTAALDRIIYTSKENTQQK